MAKTTRSIGDTRTNIWLIEAVFYPTDLFLTFKTYVQIGIFIRNEREQWHLSSLTFCSAVMVKLCSLMVMFPRLCSKAATR